jgi:hypothetical protein
VGSPAGLLGSPGTSSPNITPQPASAGPTFSVRDEPAPTPAELGDAPASMVQRLGDYLCRLATQASTDDVIDSALFLLDQATGANLGATTVLYSTEPVGSIAVLNLGVTMMAVVAGQPAGAPAPRGQGQALVAPGQLVCLPLGGTLHTIYGRLGDAVHVTRYASTRDPHAGSGAEGASFPVSAAGGAAPGNILYTAPFGAAIPSYLVAATGANTGATAVDAQIWDGPLTTGRLIGELGIPVGSTASLSGSGRLLVASGIITVVRLAGDAGQPKMSLGVQ